MNKKVRVLTFSFIIRNFHRSFIGHFCCFFFFGTISQVTIISGRRALVLSAEPGVFEELFLQERKAERANERKESCKWVASHFDRGSFRSKVVSIETKSQFDRRVNDYKNYSFASV